MHLYKYLYHYLVRKKKSDNEPNAAIIALISFIQTNNLITVLNIGLLLTNLIYGYKIHYVYIILQVLTLGLCHFYYEFKGNGKKIVNNKKYAVKIYGLIWEIFMILSVILAGYTYYLLREL